MSEKDRILVTEQFRGISNSSKRIRSMALFAIEITVEDGARI